MADDTGSKVSRWRQVNAIFEQALAADADHRDAILEAACTGDSELEQAVRSLLAADRAAARFLEDAPGPAGAISAPDLHLPSGYRIGPYRLLRPIGQGGMSTVYLARREEGFNREVALKLIRRDMESPEAERRLRGERKILAHLDHASIARLLDGGTTEEGLPYFVMELVEGVPIDLFCDQQQLTIAARVRLFSKILEAVHYAHQNLIVHRDLKPSNILVTGDGHPKLLDFGISKVLNARLATGDGGEATATWARVLTPSYASPEQIRGTPVTTGSDIYSLGVLLFKLLTGSLPHRFENRTPEEVEQTLRELTPPKPSAVFGAEQAPAAEAIAAARQMSAAQLRARLRGDLDAIVTQAIRPAPRRRYGSVEQFGDDLKRHLNGFPVLASPDSLVYRAGKYLRRHAKAVAGAALLVVTLAALVGALARQNLQLAKERDRVRQQRDATTRVLAFTERILGLADPAVAQGKPWTVAEALRRGDALIENELDEAPGVRSQLHGTVGRVFGSLGESEEAIDHLRKALDIRRRVHGAASVETAEAMSDLASAWVAAGEYARGEALALQAVVLYRAREVGQGPGVIAALNTYVYALCADGDFASANDASVEALTLARRWLDARDPELSRAMHNRAHLLNQHGDTEGAERLYREVLTIRQTVLGEPHPAVASTQVNLAMTLERQGKHNEAESFLQLALAQQRLLFGGRHPDLAPTLNNLAVLYQALDRWAEAEAVYRQAIDLFPDGNIQHLRFRTELAALLDKTERGAAAEALLRQELGYWRSELEAGNSLIAWAENTLGAVLTKQRRFDEAELLLVRSVPLIRARRGPKDAYTRKAEGRLARLREAVTPSARARLAGDPADGGIH